MQFMVKNEIFLMPPALPHEYQNHQRGCFYNFACIEHAIFQFLYDKIRLCLRHEIDLSDLCKSCLGYCPWVNQEKGVLDLRKQGCRIYDILKYLLESRQNKYNTLSDEPCNLFASIYNVHS